MRKLRHWFPWTASVLVFAGSLAGSYHVFQSAQNGVIPWLPYPAFALFVFLVFTFYRNDGG